MSTIKIKGYAARKVNADRIRYSISFYSKDLKVSKASERAKEQCELFLQEMKKTGFDISRFHLIDDDISKDYSKEEVTATRTIGIDMPFDPKFSNLILQIIKDQDLAVKNRYGLLHFR